VSTPGQPIGAIYAGDVVHKRARPKRHSLRYSVFSLLIDLDKLAELDSGFRLFSVNRFNFFSFFEKDFGPHDGSSIAAFLRRKAAAAGLPEIARIRMLAYPRMFGYAFNPLTVYYLDDETGRTIMLVYEVRNTFGEHHFYQARTDAESGEQIVHDARKAFFVSPFNTLEGSYRFTIRPPTENVFMGISLATEEGGILTAYFEGERQVLSDWNLLKLALAYPFMTGKVMVGIHWEALILWLKGVPLTLKLRRELRRSKSAPR
jgi:DUF1365 family protein